MEKDFALIQTENTAPFTHRSSKQVRPTDLPLISMCYSSQLQGIQRITARHLPILYSDGSYRMVLGRSVRYVARRARTIENIISPSLYVSNPPPRTWLNANGMYRCGVTRCSCCNHLDDSHIIIFLQASHSWLTATQNLSYI